MIKNLKEYGKFIENNEFAPSIADAIGAQAAKDLNEKIRTVTPETTWISMGDSLKKDWKLSQFQCGMLLGFFAAYQAVSETGLTIGE